MFQTRRVAHSARSESSEPRAGPSGLSIHASVALTIECTGNGHSTNGSSSDTPKRPRKRARRPDTWKREWPKRNGRGVRSTCLRPRGKLLRLERPDLLAPVD